MQECKAEKQALSSAIVNFDKYLSDEAVKKYKLPAIGFKEIVQKLIVYLRQGLNMQANTKTMMRIMDILITIIDDAPEKQIMQVKLNQRVILGVLMLLLREICKKNLIEFHG